jgi:Fe-S-cluster-containing hydrogenase component 2
MTTKTLRKVVKIDEELCNGCGVCITTCAEGALKIIGGKARLISEKYCDGLGNCLKCPQGAISIEEREAEDFSEEAVKEHLEVKPTPTPAPVHACPGSAIRQFSRAAAPAVSKATAPATPEKTGTTQESRLTHWPVQLALVPPTAPFLKGADLILAAHCAAFADPNFQQEFLKENTALVIACPKLDDYDAHQEKLTRIFKESGIKSITVVHMEVPCCGGLLAMVKQAMLASGNILPFKDVTVGIHGECKTA